MVVFPTPPLPLIASFIVLLPYKHPRKWGLKYWPSEADKNKLPHRDVDRSSRHRSRRLHYRLGERRVLMDHASNIAAGGSHSHSQRDLMDKHAGFEADDLGAQDFVGGRVGNNLHEALRLAVDKRFSVGHEREAARLHFMPAFSRPLLGEAYGCYLRRGKDAIRHYAIVYPHLLA